MAEQRRRTSRRSDTHESDTKASDHFNDPGSAAQCVVLRNNQCPVTKLLCRPE